MMLNKIAMVNKIFILITFISTLTLVISTGIILYFVDKSIVNEVIESEKLNLQRTAYSIELMIKEANNLARHINSNLKTRKTLYNSNISNFDVSEGINTLRNIQYLTQEVHSLYIYNNKLDKIYYTGENLKTESVFKNTQFFDSAYIEESIKNGRINTLKPHRRILMEYNYLTDKLEPEDVYTFVYSFSHQNNYSDSSLIVVNISIKWLQKSISSLDQSPQHRLEVLDNEKNPILSKYKDRGEFYKLFDEFPNEKEFVIKRTVGDSPSYIIVLESPYLTNWYFLKFIDINSVLNKTNIIKRTVFLIAICVLLVMIIAAWFSTKAFRKPINDLLYIAEKQSLNEELNLKTMTSAKMKTLIDFYDDFTPHEIKTILKDCHSLYSIDNDFYLLFIYSKELSNNITLESVQKYFLSEFNAVSYQNTKPELLSVILQDSKISNSNFRECIKDGYLTAGGILSEKCTLLYSPKKLSLVDLGEEVQKGKDLSSYVKCFDYTGIIDIDSIEKQQNTNGIYPQELEKTIIKALVEKDKLSLFTSADKFVIDISKSNLRFYYRSLNRIMRTLYEELRIINPLITRGENMNNLESLLNSLNDYKSIKEHKIFLNGFLEQNYNIITDISEVKDDNQINKIISYIINNYENPGLGSQMIADYINLNPTYLQTIFKKETKRSLHEYINNFRLKKSLELLESTSLPIKDILLKIGFTNEQSFFRLFKKEFNRTPSQFRNTINSNNI